jgi:hypothetical protein
MKNRLIAIAFTTGLILSLAFVPQQNKDCNVEEALKACKRELLPYSFQDRKTITFRYTAEKQLKEYKVQLFKGERYRFVFNSTYSPGAEFEVYDMPKDKSPRKLLYDSLKDENSENIFLYHPKELPYVYVNLIVPAGDKNHEGCATIMIGYELTFEDGG